MRVETQRIQDQLRHAITGDGWHGPSVSEVVESFDAANTAWRAYGDGHSPCEVLLHSAVWLEVTARRLKGDKAYISDAEDWPKPAAGSVADAWSAAAERLHEAHETLQELLDNVQDARLTDVVTGQTYTVYFMLHGAIQHSLYHAGQMMLLSRMIRAGR